MNLSDKAPRWLVFTSLVAITLSALHRATRQERRLRLAGSHAPVVRSLLENDARYDEVTAHRYTGDGGVLLLYGHVNEEADLERLKTLVKSTETPVPVKYRVFIRGALDEGLEDGLDEE